MKALIRLKTIDLYILAAASAVALVWTAYWTFHPVAVLLAWFCMLCLHTLSFLVQLFWKGYKLGMKRKLFGVSFAFFTGLTGLLLFSGPWLPLDPYLRKLFFSMIGPWAELLFMGWYLGLSYTELRFFYEFKFQ